MPIGRKVKTKFQYKRACIVLSFYHKFNSNLYYSGYHQLYTTIPRRIIRCFASRYISTACHRPELFTRISKPTKFWNVSIQSKDITLQNLEFLLFLIRKWREIQISKLYIFWVDRDILELFSDLRSLRKVLSNTNIILFQKTLSERTGNGSCRTDIGRPKGTVVSIFGMQKQWVLRVAQNWYYW